MKGTDPTESENPKGLPDTVSKPNSSHFPSIPGYWRIENAMWLPRGTLPNPFICVLNFPASKMPAEVSQLNWTLKEEQEFSRQRSF